MKYRVDLLAEDRNSGDSGVFIAANEEAAIQQAREKYGDQFPVVEVHPA